MTARVGSEARRVALAHDDARVEARLRLATPPHAVSPEVPVAPARGKVVAQAGLHVTEMTPNGPRTHRATTDGFHPARAEDAFDRMTIKAKNRKGKDMAPLFTVAQVEAGRAYARLFERCAAEGVRCSSPEARSGGGGAPGGRDWIDGVIARSRLLDEIQAAIGDGVALSPRNARAHADRGRRVIMVRQLVDAVCIEGQTLRDVLAANGWSRGPSAARVLHLQLSAALDRMWLVS